MARSDYGFRYPGGHSIVDYGQSKSDFGDYVTESDKMLGRSRSKYKARCLELRNNKQRGPAFSLLSPGARIKHIALGCGTVLSVDESRATIRFDNGKTQIIKRQKINKNAHLLNLPNDSDRSAAESRNPSVEAYSPLPNRKKHLEQKVVSRISRTESRLIGCIATDSRNSAFVITDISDGWLRMINLRTDVAKQFRYPECLIDGTVRIGPNVDVGLQRERQETAADVVKSLRKKAKSV